MISKLIKRLDKETIAKIRVPIFLMLLSILLVGIISLKQKDVTIIIDGQSTNIVTYKTYLADALETNGIHVGVKDKIFPDVNSKISDDEVINIKKAMKINIIDNDEAFFVYSAEEDIISMIKAESIVLKDKDKILPSKDTRLVNNMNVEIVRVDENSFTEKVELDYKTVIKKDENWPTAKQEVVQEGKLGEKNVTTKVTYENGKEVSRAIVSEETLSEPKDKIIVQGTLPTLHVSRGGEPVGYTKVFNAKATAYYATSGVGRTYTASGRLAVRDTNGYSTIAVDPKVIPYGTKLYVEGYGFAIAADTGTSIIGNTIDVFFNTYSEACNWGLKYVNVYILK